MERQRERTYIGISWKRERGREEESKNRDLSNRFLKTDRGTDSRELHRDLSEEKEGKRKRARAEI